LREFLIVNRSIRSYHFYEFNRPIVGFSSTPKLHSVIYSLVAAIGADTQGRSSIAVSAITGQPSTAEASWSNFQTIFAEDMPFAWVSGNE
jgi:hypothetical protein